MLSLSFKISLRDRSFYISLNCLGFYLSRCLLNFLWLVYSNKCGKKFSIYGVHIRRKSLNLCFFTHASVPHSKLLVNFFWKSFSPKTERMGGSYDLLSKSARANGSIKIQSESMKMAWNISLFPFGMIAVFSKCDGFRYNFVNNIYQIVWH